RARARQAPFGLALDEEVGLRPLDGAVAAEREHALVVELHRAGRERVGDGHEVGGVPGQPGGGGPRGGARVKLWGEPTSENSGRRRYDGPAGFQEAAVASSARARNAPPM